MISTTMYINTMTDLLICSKCKKGREIEDFKSSRTGKTTKACRTCLDKQKGRVLSEEEIAKRKEYQRNYYLNVFKPKFKTYYTANKDKFIAHSKKHYNKKLNDENHDPIIYETINCGCGGKYKQPAITKHSKTKKHQRWMAEQEASDEGDEEQPGLEEVTNETVEENLDESLENLENIQI